jgi:hypothetical protein
VLHDDSYLEKFNLCRVPHSLEADQKRSRAEVFQELFQLSEQDQRYEFEHILTGDESWFFFEYFHHSCKVANPNDVPEPPKQKFNRQNVSFRLFEVAEQSKICCMFQKA